MLLHHRDGLSSSSLCLIFDNSVSFSEHSVCWRFGVSDFQGSNPTFSRGRQVVSLRFENGLPVTGLTTTTNIYMEPKLVLTVPADVVAPNGVRPSAGTMLTEKLDMFSFCSLALRTSDVIKNYHLNSVSVKTAQHNTILHTARKYISLLQTGNVLNTVTMSPCSFI